MIKWPIIDQDDIAAVTGVMRRGVFVKGPVAKKLESRFAEYIGVSFCRAVSSCTHAIHLALRAIGVRPGDEVLVPNLTYCGTVSPIVNCGATPVFVDVDQSSYNISVSDAVRKRTSFTKAIIPVHLHGYPCNISAIREQLPELLVIEDACQAHGAMRSGSFAGSWGDVGCFSLNQVKPLCGGQGGLIVTNNPSIWNVITELASPGMNSTVGLSYEIAELSAALALSQLGKLESFIKNANNNYNMFVNILDAPLVESIHSCENGVRPTWHKLRIKHKPKMRELLLNALGSNQIPYEIWPETLVSQRSEYGKFVSNTSNSSRIMGTTFILGNEAYPFQAQDKSTVMSWAQVLNTTKN